MRVVVGLEEASALATDNTLHDESKSVSLLRELTTPMQLTTQESKFNIVTHPGAAVSILDHNLHLQQARLTSGEEHDSEIRNRVQRKLP